MKRTIFLLPLLALLSGCLATLDGQFENALAPSLACDKTFIVSEYMRWGITGQLRKADHEKIREKFCPKDAQTPVDPRLVPQGMYTPAQPGVGGHSTPLVWNPSGSTVTYQVITGPATAASGAK